ncbi:MAG: hypothetical protein JO300_00815 [Silvibacterium sp.]|nr:hypothetical protein [Silvibacterium sp.]
MKPPPDAHKTLAVALEQARIGVSEGGIGMLGEFQRQNPAIWNERIGQG